MHNWPRFGAFNAFCFIESSLKPSLASHSIRIVYDNNCWYRLLIFVNLAREIVLGNYMGSTLLRRCEASLVCHVRRLWPIALVVRSLDCDLRTLGLQTTPNITLFSRFVSLGNDGYGKQWQSYRGFCSSAGRWFTILQCFADSRA